MFMAKNENTVYNFTPSSYAKCSFRCMRTFCLITSTASIVFTTPPPSPASVLVTASRISITLINLLATIAICVHNHCSKSLRYRLRRHLRHSQTTPQIDISHLSCPRQQYCLPTPHGLYQSWLYSLFLYHFCHHPNLWQRHTN